ncbi:MULTISPECIES: aspartate 1-decarboxylase [unclassified Campylobacter]|uniref:aspartate 1-decarboxylase n=1 Tax=unclassified Campylobacter TaxID=2593542 RepID=UPI001237DF7F|nr:MULTISPECIES: aspartate 1-decarboxylase [unclassified Campylobacter]KAA6224691.1 aspartate 1-decarboxylase [Campylobacter sp. LR185c]KAA6225689.1 aspartate 1-decarboxylase [Campylobacter sp. LR286c]KAA6225809.1 aspartate 1-decarboxylase [Campylobacter sp. LR196d]KAA6230092.1 aspartate 1-decarboxylase [Campylobacter sp. LR264d]KAA8603967.1 aspartate 1-decarboxylase [Campylobacter sp. LR185c]
MMINMLRAKIHRAVVKEAKLDYVGSISIDERLLKASGILEYEKVQVVNINTGARFETYTIATNEEGMICLNGAAARLVQNNDKVIIMAYANLSIEEASNFKPRVVIVDENNKPCQISNYEKHGKIFEIYN